MADVTKVGLIRRGDRGLAAPNIPWLLNQARQMLDAHTPNLGVPYMERLYQLVPDNATFTQLQYEYFEYYAERVEVLVQNKDYRGALFAAEQILRFIPTNEQFQKKAAQLEEAVRTGKMPVQHPQSAQPASGGLEPRPPIRKVDPPRQPAPTGAKAETRKHFAARMEVLINTAVSRAKSREFEIAYKCLETVLREDPMNVRAWVKLVAAYEAQSGGDALITAESLGRPLTTREELIRAAQERLMVFSYLRSIPCENRTMEYLSANQPNVAALVTSTDERCGFGDLAVAMEFGDIEHPPKTTRSPRPPREPGVRTPHDPVPKTKEVFAFKGEPLAEPLPEEFDGESLWAQAQSLAATENHAAAFTVLERLLDEAPYFMPACELLVGMYRQETGWTGDVTATALGKRLSPQEQIVRIADRRLIVVKYLQSVPPEDTSAQKLSASPIAILVLGPQRVFDSVVGAREAADVALPEKERAVREPKPRPQRAERPPRPPRPERPPREPRPLERPKRSRWSPLSTEVEFNAPGRLSPEVEARKTESLQAARAAYAAEDYTAAIGEFEKALEVDPVDMEVYSLLYLAKAKGFLVSLPADVPKSVVQQARFMCMRLERAIEVILFLRNNPGVRISYDEAGNKNVWRCVYGNGTLFGATSFAREVAGVEINAETLDAFKKRIEEQWNRIEKAAADVAAADSELIARNLVEKLLRRYGPLIDKESVSAVGLLDPAVYAAVSAAGDRSGIEEAYETAKAALEQVRQAAEAEKMAAEARKRELFSAAENRFLDKEHQASADLFRKLLLETDPHDIQARCFYYLSLMHLRYEFLEYALPDYIRMGKGKSLAGRLSTVRAARRLHERIVLIRFLIGHEGKEPALTNVQAVRFVDKHMASLVAAGPAFRVFAGTREARVAAGLEHDLMLLEEVIKPAIDRETITFLGAELSRFRELGFKEEVAVEVTETHEQFRERMADLVAKGEAAMQAGSFTEAIEHLAVVAKEDRTNLVACDLIIQAYHSQLGRERPAHVLGPEDFGGMPDETQALLITASWRRAIIICLKSCRISEPTLKKYHQYIARNMKGIRPYLFGPREGRVFLDLAEALQLAGIKIESAN